MEGQDNGKGMRGFKGSVKANFENKGFGRPFESRKELEIIEEDFKGMRDFYYVSEVVKCHRHSASKCGFYAKEKGNKMDITFRDNKSKRVCEDIGDEDGEVWEKRVDLR